MALVEYLKRSIYMNLIYEDRYLLILSGLWVTLLLTISSFVLGTILGMAFCAGKGSRNKAVRWLCNTVTAIMVKLPPLVLRCVSETATIQVMPRSCMDLTTWYSVLASRAEVASSMMMIVGS